MLLREGERDAGAALVLALAVEPERDLRQAGRSAIEIALAAETLDQLDGERIAIHEALGYTGPHFPLAHHYAREGEEWMYGRGSHDRLTDSGDWRENIVLTEHRYMREDLRTGLSFFLSCAELAGVETPLVKAFLAIGGAICGENFFQGGRTLTSLGFGDLKRDPLQKLLREGFTA